MCLWEGAVTLQRPRPGWALLCSASFLVSVAGEGGLRHEFFLDRQRRRRDKVWGTAAAEASNGSQCASSWWGWRGGAGGLALLLHLLFVHLPLLCSPILKPDFHLQKDKDGDADDNCPGETPS